MTEAPLDHAGLGTLLGALASRPGSAPKYRYPSAGTLYPVQTYVALRSGLGPLAPGSFYYDPDTHELIELSTDTPAAPDGSTPSILLLLAAQRDAIAPIYGAEADGFSLLEAGYMTEALRAAAGGVSLRDSGDPAANADLIRAFRLEDNHAPLVCLAIEEASQ